MSFSHVDFLLHSTTQQAFAGRARAAPLRHKKSEEQGPNRRLTMANRDLNEDEIADLKEAFNMFDIDGSGESNKQKSGGGSRK